MYFGRNKVSVKCFFKTIIVGVQIYICYWTSQSDVSLSISYWKFRHTKNQIFNLQSKWIIIYFKHIKIWNFIVIKTNSLTKKIIRINSII